jgi:hypothetical protein
MTASNDREPNPRDSKKRRAYAPPTVTEFGSVHELTRGQSGLDTDGLSGMSSVMVMMM